MDRFGALVKVNLTKVGAPPPALWLLRFFFFLPSGSILSTRNHQSHHPLFWLVCGAGAASALGKQILAGALCMSLVSEIWGDFLPYNLSALMDPREVIDILSIQLLLASVGALMELKSEESRLFIFHYS